MRASALPTTAGASRASFAGPPIDTTPAASSSDGDRLFHLNGWSNSVKAYKAIGHATCGDAALIADLPENLEIKYVKKEDAPTAGYVELTMKLSGDNQRLVALDDFFKQHSRVGVMALPAGGTIVSAMVSCGAGGVW